MIFDIRQLDNLDYDDAEPLLEDFIEDAIEAFVNSSTGQEYIKAHPQGGNWIGSFLEMAYLYEALTPAKMKKGDAQTVMEYILPRKLTLLDPSEAEDAIPELVAFWTFLKEDYKLRSAGAIAKYLKSIEKKFPKWMVDPSRGGIAKNFMMQGMQAGYDMTSEEGVAAFQEQYNQQVRSQQAVTNDNAGLPRQVQQQLQALGIQLPPAGEPLNPMALLVQMLNAPLPSDGLLGNADDDGEDNPDSFESSISQSIRARVLSWDADKFPPLSAEGKEILAAQTITETEPGPILKDFQTILDFIGSDGILVSGKRNQISLKLLGEINQRLSQPNEIDLKRPQQKSYPTIHGLYLLLRATGIVKLARQGKQRTLVLNPPIYESWQQLNPTERYCTLLEAWLVRAHGEMLGEEQSPYMTEGDTCLQSWPELTRKKRLSFATYKDQDQQRLNDYPGYHNLALMELFGVVKITTNKPESGKGWRIRYIEALPLGKALMELLRETYETNEFSWPSETDPSRPFNDLQPALSPYFPEWQQTLAIPNYAFQPGRHIFKVSLGKAWRRIAISGEATLADLAGLILDSVEFDYDHLDQFTYTNHLGRKVEVVHPAFEDGEYFTNAVKIGSLPIQEGSLMEYLFDFGDCWEFSVELEAVETQSTSPANKGSKSKKKSKQLLGEIVEVHGKAPSQYPNYDEDW